MTDYSSLFEVRLATYDDIPSILDITHEAFVKYAELAGLTADTFKQFVNTYSAYYNVDASLINESYISSVAALTLSAAASQLSA